jgi:hypothetical protein
VLAHEQASPRHLARHGQVEERAQAGCDIGEPAVAQADGTGLARDPPDRHRVGGVRGVRTTGRGVDQLLDVAVIGADEQRSAAREHGSAEARETCVDGLDRSNARADHTRVSDHVGIRVVHEHEAIVVLRKGFEQRVRDGDRTHLGLQVVGRHVARRGDQDAILARERLLAPAVEEVGDVRVFLGLGDAQLASPRGCDELAEARAHSGRGENRRQPEGLVVFRERREDCGSHARQRRHRVAELLGPHACERVGELARAIRAEVEEEHRVAVAKRRAAVDHGRRDELVALVCGPAALDGLHRRGAGAALARDDRLVRARDAFPVLVAVHREVASGERGDAAAKLATTRLER